MERNEKKKQLSGAQKRKKKKEKEEAIERARAGGVGEVEAWTDQVMDRVGRRIIRMCSSRTSCRN